MNESCSHEPVQIYDDGSFWCGKCDREVTAAKRFYLADYIGFDRIVGGWFFYIGPLMLRWHRG